MFIFIIEKEINLTMKKSDFGDILDKWENNSHNSHNSHKKAMNELLENYKIYDKDANLKETFAPGEKRRLLLHKKPDDILDIHGFTSEDAWLFLENFFINARENGYQKLRIIHGKGSHTKGLSTLSLLVRKYIERCPFAGESGFEKSVNGGSGAVWVFLKD
jgi:DNA-nicking Smr family endonuclease